MNLPAFKRLDKYTFEMIVILFFITLYDFLLSDALSIPVALGRSQWLAYRSLDRLVSSLELLVPVVILIVMAVLWLAGRNHWERRLAIAYLLWVTLRLIIKVALVILIAMNSQVVRAPVLLKDTFVLFFIISVLFGVWYWIIDGGGPQARRSGEVKRYDFSFPQQSQPLPGWEGWQPGLWDYIHLGFSGSTQLGPGGSNVYSVRAKCLVMLQVSLSLLILVFLASFAIGLLK